MSTGGTGGNLLRALSVDITLTTDHGGVPAWVDNSEETRQKLIETAQRIFRDTLDGLVRFEHEHISQESYSQSLVVFAVPTTANRDIALGGIRELASRMEEDISSKIGRMGATPSVRIVQDRSFTGGGPAAHQQAPGGGYPNQGAVTVMHSGGDNGGSVPMVLVPAGYDQPRPDPAASVAAAVAAAESRPVIPSRMLPLLLASAIAGISIAANLFLVYRWSELKSVVTSVNADMKETNANLSDEKSRADKAEGELTALRGQNAFLESPRRLYTEAKSNEAKIRQLGGGAKLRPVPELDVDGWERALREYIPLQNAELARLQQAAAQRAANNNANRARIEQPNVPPSARQ